MTPPPAKPGAPESAPAHRRATMSELSLDSGESVAVYPPTSGVLPRGILLTLDLGPGKDGVMITLQAHEAAYIAGALAAHAGVGLEPRPEEAP